MFTRIWAITIAAAVVMGTAVAAGARSFRQPADIARTTLENLERKDIGTTIQHGIHRQI
jgi:hypothetical protein